MRLMISIGIGNWHKEDIIMSVVKVLESLEYGEGDGGLDVVEYKGRVCMMEYDRGGSLGNILEMKNGKCRRIVTGKLASQCIM